MSQYRTHTCSKFNKTAVTESKCTIFGYSDWIILRINKNDGFENQADLNLDINIDSAEIIITTRMYAKIKYKIQHIMMHSATHWTSMHNIDNKWILIDDDNPTTPIELIKTHKNITTIFCKKLYN